MKGNYCGVEGAKEIRKLLRSNKTLTSLNLAGDVSFERELIIEMTDMILDYKQRIV